MQEVESILNSTRRAAQVRSLHRAESSHASARIHVAPRSRKKASVIVRKLASGLAAFLAAFILTSIFASDSGRMRLLTNTIPEISTAISFVGFGLDQVSVKGQRYTLVGDIFEALDLDKSPTFASFDAATARARIEALSWVSTAELRRVYPNQLRVTITERKPFALWQNAAGSTALVDQEGRVLASVSLADAPAGLARIKGTGAPQEVSDLWTDLARYPAIKSLIREATRVGNRRWTLTLENDTHIELPSGAVAAALNQLEDWPGFAGIKEHGGAHVDMRTPGRIAVRPIAPVGPTSKGPRNIADLLGPAG